MDRIIPICSAIALSLIATSAEARRESLSPLAAFVQARIAITMGDDLVASKLLGDVMVASPNDLAIAKRSWRQAVNAGDRAVAIRAALTLERLDAVGPDARILLFVESLRKNDWTGANVQIDKIEQGGAFGFFVPSMRAWTRLAARKDDPLVALDAVTKDGFSGQFADEQRCLILLALGRKDDAIATINRLGGPAERWVPLRLTAAARMVALKDSKAALELIAGDDPAFVVARAQIAAGKALPGATQTPLGGTAALLARVASDLMAGESTPIALSLAQLSAFAETPSSTTILVRARAFQNAGRTEEALADLEAIGADDPMASRAEALRFAIYSESNRLDQALALADTAIARPGSGWRDHAQRGEALARMEKHADAAASYGRAIEMVAASTGPNSVPWNLWLLYGESLERSGQWARAKPALQKAVDFGPNQATPLNYLGYSMLEAGDNPDEALMLIVRASALRPDDAAITDSLGWAYFKRGEYDKAVPTLERAFAIDPTLSEIGEHLGDAYWTSGRRVQARYTWQAALLQADGKAVDRIKTKLDRGLVTKVN